MCNYSTKPSDFTHNDLTTALMARDESDSDQELTIVVGGKVLGKRPRSLVRPDTAPTLTTYTRAMLNQERAQAIRLQRAAIDSGEFS